MRLIDADVLKESLKASFDSCTEWIKTAENDEIRHVAEGSRNAFLEAILRVKDQPTVPYDMKWNPECEDCLPENINDCIECKKRTE